MGVKLVLPSMIFARSIFRLVNMTDDSLTLGPEPNSKLLDRAQGFYGSASQNEIAFLMVVHFAFTNGKYNGRTLAVIGRNSITQASREMPIAGGTGGFRLARGIANAKAYYLNTTTGVAIVECNVFAIHY